MGTRTHTPVHELVILRTTPTDNFGFLSYERRRLATISTIECLHLPFFRLKWTWSVSTAIDCSWTACCFDSKFKDRKEGKGVMNWVERRERYTGDWKQDLQCGYGVHVWIEERCGGRSNRGGGTLAFTEGQDISFWRK